MIKQLLLVVLSIMAMVAALAYRKPDNFRVERSTMIKAPPERVFALINDFHNFSVWSPWERLDPDMTRSITGSATGKGAIYEWSGNLKAGAGRMEILESTSSSRVRMRLDFARRIFSTNTAEYTLAAHGDSTKVTWVMYGPSPFLSKVVQVYRTMDEMIGDDLAKGLVAMKTAAEKP